LEFMTTRISHCPFSKLVGDEDRGVLRKAGVCCKCRQLGHMSTEYLDKGKDHPARPIIKIESIEQPAIVESD